MKMETPKMDVVRFKEADVIVASPVPVVHTTKAAGFNNESVGDANIIYKGVSYTDAHTLNSALEADGLAGIYQLYIPGKDTHSYYGTEDMFYIDENPQYGIEHSILIPDGDYDWNGSAFVYRQ